MLAERLLAPVVDAGVDTLLLGCTHYPYLARTISDVMGREVVLVSSADETAFAVRAVFDGHPSAAELPAVDRARVTRPATASCRSATSNGSGSSAGALLGPELDDTEGVTWAPSPPVCPAA